MTEFHADYLAADEAHRWTKALHELAVRLREGAWKAKGAWVYWILPAGACVAMRVIPPEAGGGRSSPTAGGQSFRKELRLSRRGILKPDEALWHAEVEIFKRHLGVEEWEKGVLLVERDPDTATYRAVATLLERSMFLAGAKPPDNLCTRCGKPTPHEPAFKADLCPKCAADLGAEEVASRQHALDLPPGGEPT